MVFAPHSAAYFLTAEAKADSSFSTLERVSSISFKSSALCGLILVDLADEALFGFSGLGGSAINEISSSSLLPSNPSVLDRIRFTLLWSAAGYEFSVAALSFCNALKNCLADMDVSNML